MVDHGPKIAQVASLIGDPARANMLAALMDGRPRSASDLAGIAGVSPQTASGHLARLRDAQLLALEIRGRHRDYRLASPGLASLLEQIMVVAQQTPARLDARPWRGGEGLRTARCCYDHLAGRIAVAITGSLVSGGHLHLGPDGGGLTTSGTALFAAAGVAVPGRTGRRAYCRPCMDWSERQPHLAGTLGAAVLTHVLDRGWVRRVPDSRALDVTPVGRAGFARAFGISA